MDSMSSFPVSHRTVELHQSSRPDWEFKEEAELLKVESGSLRIFSPDGDQAFTLREGEGAFIPPKSLHMIRNATDDAAFRSIVFRIDIIWLDSAGTVFSRYVAPLLKPALGFVSLSPSSASLIDKAFESLSEKRFAYELEVRDMISSMIVGILREHSEELRVRNAITNERLIRMLSFIRDNYQSDIGLSAISNAGAVSERECLRVFRRTIGTSPIQYLISYRLGIAVNLMEDENLNISQIAERSGFSNPSVFSRCFRRAYGRAPLEWRKGLRSQGR